jgi:putative ABC transport system permease protein
MSHLSREILAFSLTLAAPAGLAGSLLAVYSLDLVKRLAPIQLPRLETTSGDWRTPLVALVLAAVCALAMSVFPLLHVRRARLGLSGTRVSGGRQRLNGALVIMEVALSAVLLISASLLIRSAQKLAQVNPGFRTSRILVAPFSLPAGRYPTPESRAAFWNRLVEQLRAIPGVEDASFTTEAPLSGVNNPTPFGAITEDGKSHFFYARGVTPGYLEMMGIPLREGSSITREHRAGTPRVVVINETMRRDLFGTANPIGRKLSFDFEAAPAVIAGVVGDIRHDSLRATPFREAYFPMEQNPLNKFDLVVRTAFDPNSIVAGVREAVRAVDPRQAIGPIATLDDYIARDLAQPRFRGFMLALFAALAVVLASLGLYGVISYLVAQRTKEVGIRMALGATCWEVMQLILTFGGRLVGAGLVAGLAAAWGLTRVLSGLVFGISLRDPLTFASACLILVATALTACYIPARRASQLDPATVLQNER